MRTLKRTIAFVYIALILCMAVATIIEKYKGTDFVSGGIYGAWWFSLLWAVLVAATIAYFIKLRVKSYMKVSIHLSFIIILFGAFLTHISAHHGMVHLRIGESVDKYYSQDDDNIKELPLPFAVRLNSFDVTYHNGTTAVEDYKSTFSIIDGKKTTDATVSMNNIYSYNGTRFYQSSYDDDMRGSILSINADPYGIPVTYAGYALLFISLLWMLIDRNGEFRTILRSGILKRGVVIIAALLTLTGAKATNVLDRETADRFGKINILYNNRISSTQTFAIDFTKKLYGSKNYKMTDGDSRISVSPEQVITGFIFWGDEWSNEPIIKLKKGELRNTLQLPEYVSVNTFFNRDMGGYILGPYLNEYYNGQRDEFHKQAADLDDRLQMVMELRRGSLLKMFPNSDKGVTTWYAPTDNFLNVNIDSTHVKYIQNVFSVLYQDVKNGDTNNFNEIVDGMVKYQKEYGGSSLPSPAQVKAESIYNAIPFATILFMVNLTVGFITLFIEIRRLTNNGKGKLLSNVGRIVMPLSWLMLTVGLALRWIISGTIPMANGYETMLFVAWTVMLISMFMARSIAIMSPFGFIMSGFFLLVAHIGQMDPQITHVMPVLNSPLLCIHVSIIMIGFAILSMTFICSGIALFTDKDGILYNLSRLLLLPALTFLSIGIFVGAIWANVSWGTYWSWDPKEVWALITFMVYAVPVHSKSIASMNKHKTYNIYMVLAFMTILMTYFGVNYFLCGMHSYA